MCRKQNRKRYYSLLLSFLMLFQTGTAFAANETVSQNETVSANDAAGGQAEEKTEAEDIPIEDAVSGQTMQKVQAGAGNPANPVHHCNKENADLDVTDYSYIYFGSYPQSEVTDSSIRTAIDRAIPVSGIEIKAGIDDVWVNGSKYRRISDYDKNYENYEDDVANNGYLYFKWERIKWRVLANDGNTLFIMADRIIDHSGYFSDNQWEKSKERAWLNDYFYHAAFNSNEQKAIATWTVVNEDNPEYGTAGGNNTKDNIFFLSISEASNEDYGFCSDYQIESMSRKIEFSDYSKAKGAGGGWWLRSPGNGESGFRAAYVSNGAICVWGAYSTFPSIRPALHINFSSPLWSMTDDGTSGTGGDEKTAAPVASIQTGSRVEKNTKLLLSCSNREADIYYTTDGTVPTTASARYAGGITIDRDMTVKAIAICRGYRISDVLEVSYKVNEKKLQMLSIQAPSRKLAAGKKVKLSLKFVPEDATNKAVKWKSSNEKYAAVDKDGTITLKKAGIGRQVTITAEAQDGSGKKSVIKIKIMGNAIKSLKLTFKKKTLKAGKSMTIKATVKAAGKNANKSLKWTSSNIKYATVNNKGKVTAKKAGKGKTVTITARTTDGSNKKAALKIKIK